jgi:hypothetical protein
MERREHAGIDGIIERNKAKRGESIGISLETISRRTACGKGS